MKYIQNQIAESRQTLPATMVYSAVVWLLAGVIQEGWWMIQFPLFLISAFLMMQLNNVNLLIRIYSRMISVSFVMLSCAAAFLFPSATGGFVQFCFIVSILSLFNTYQELPVVGWLYYAFLFLSLASLVEVRILLYLPLFWFLMLVTIHARGWRAITASVLGILTPYWFMVAWLFYIHRHEFDFSLLISHFGDLSAITLSDFAIDDLQRLLTLTVVIILGIVGGIHFIMKHYEDKFRVRQLYYSFIYLALYTFALMFVIPSQFDMLLRILIIAASPLIGHFFALTKTKVSNIFFLVTAGIILILTLFNLWSSSSIF